MQERKYPTAFYKICVAYGMERFGFFGSRAILVLFLAKEIVEGGLGINSSTAAMIAASLTAFTYMTPLVGGWLADKIIGARYIIILGYILVSVGFLVGYLSDNINGIYILIAFVALGSGMLKGNLSALIGKVITKKEDLDSAFSIQYSFVNIGSFLGSMISGVVYISSYAQTGRYSFRHVFFICCIATIIGMIAFLLTIRDLGEEGKRPFKYGISEASAKSRRLEHKPLTNVEKKGILAIVFMSLLSCVFWLLYYQQDLVILLYLDEFVNMRIGRINLAPQHLTITLNSLLCIVLSLFAAKLWRRLAQRKKGDLSIFRKITIAFFFITAAYVVLSLMEIVRGIGSIADIKASAYWIVLFEVLLTMAEICFSPLGASFVSKVAPDRYISQMMGVWSMSTFLAAIVNGFVEGYVQKLGIYVVFITFTIISATLAITMCFFIKKLECLTSLKQE